MIIFFSEREEMKTLPKNHKRKRKSAPLEYTHQHTHTEK